MSRRIIMVGKRPVRLIPEYVQVAEVQIGGKKYPIQWLFNAIKTGKGQWNINSCQSIIYSHLLFI